MTVRAFLVSAVTLVGVIACGGTALLPSSQSPSGSPAPRTSPLPTAAGSTGPWTQLSWSRPNPVPDDATILDVVAWHGGYVATGQAIVGGQRVGVALASADGLSWQRRAVLPGNATLVPTASRLVALSGSSFDRSPGIEAWASVDGLSWQRDGALALPDVTLARSVARGDTIVAVGADAAGRAALWRSSDGAAWIRGEPPPHAIVRDIAMASDGFIVLGRDGEPDVASGGIGSPGVGLPAAWWSAVGQTWTALQVDGVPAAGAQLSQAYAVADGYFAIGSDSATPGANARSPLVWTSADGRTWTLAGPPPHWGGPLGTNGREAVVLAYLDPTANPEGWLTRDGRSWTRVPFGGDVAHIPVVQQFVGMTGHIDRIFVVPQGIVVVGQVVVEQNSRLAVWFADASGR